MGWYSPHGRRLELKDLENIFGGISRKEYCKTLDRMAQGSWNNWDAHRKKAFADAWSAHC